MGQEADEAEPDGQLQPARPEEAPRLAIPGAVLAGFDVVPGLVVEEVEQISQQFDPIAAADVEELGVVQI